MKPQTVRLVLPQQLHGPPALLPSGSIVIAWGCMAPRPMNGSIPAQTISHEVRVFLNPQAKQTAWVGIWVLAPRSGLRVLPDPAAERRGSGDKSARHSSPRRGRATL